MNNIGKINSTADFLFTFLVNRSRLRGASGSPVLNTQGQVAGVIFYGNF